MPSPLKRPHGRIHAYLSWWLVEYQDATPGTETFDNASAILGSHSEPQPDSCLLILPPGKGQTRDEDDFIIGAPELVVEIAAGTKDLDLGAKKKDYEKAGVREYLVASLEENRVYWFSLRKGKFKEVPPGADGTYGSEAFPGLWLDPAALLRRDKKRLLEVLRQGLATPAHAAFVKRLAEK